MARKPRSIGHLPKSMYGWDVVKEFHSPSFGDWVWIKRHGEDWDNYKLLSTKRRHGKANLYLSYSKVEARYSNTLDQRWLTDNLPELLEELTLFIVEGI